VKVSALADSVDARVPQSITALHDELHLFTLIWRLCLLSRNSIGPPCVQFSFYTLLDVHSIVQN